VISEVRYSRHDRAWCAGAVLMLALGLVGLVLAQRPDIKYSRFLVHAHRGLVPASWYVRDLHSPDPATRAKAAYALSFKSLDVDVSPLLLPALGDPSPAVRRWALSGLSICLQVRGTQIRVPLPVLRQQVEALLQTETDGAVRGHGDEVMGLLDALTLPAQTPEPPAAPGVRPADAPQAPRSGGK
jgi:hypothetical protein